VTPTLSLATKLETGTVREVAAAGRVKALTTGRVLSRTGRVMPTVALLLSEMLPAA
jgi:hypothetical protein